MKKIILFALIAIIVLSISGAVSATMLIPLSDQAKENAKAPENSPVINKTIQGEWEFERVDFIHYARPTNPAKPVKTETCYKLMGVKWTDFPVSHVINPTNPQGLEDSSIFSAINIAAETWDTQTSKELLNDNVIIDNSAQYGVQDYKNAIAFGNYSDANVIAVTSVWYTRVGKRIVEFDMLFDTDFVWGDATINSGFMDLQNIATHEIGHAIGLSDIYSDYCIPVTMYGYSSEGDIEKRTLEYPDIIGLQKLYGI